MKRTLLIVIILFGTSALPGCAVVWVADKTVDTAVFAVETTVKTGAAVGDLIVPDDDGDDEESND